MPKHLQDKNSVSPEAMTAGELRMEVESLRAEGARLRSARRELAQSGAVADSHEMYRRVIAESPIGIVICDSTGQCRMTNDSMARMIGDEPAQVLAQNFHEIESWKRSGIYEAALQAISTGRTQHIDTDSLISSFGRKVYLNFFIVPFTDAGVMFMVHDRTGQRIAEEGLERKTRELLRANAEKEVFLSEVHRRAKNNLATVSSILRMQSHMVSDEEFRDILRQCQDRINAMALVHEHLYGTGEFAGVGLKAYVDSLIAMISECYLRDTGVSIASDIDDISLDIEQLISIGMIINEAVTNSLKHAFPGGSPGEGSVAIRRDGESVVLTVSDSGRGLPGEGEPRDLNSFGMKLMRVFTRQLYGEIELGIDGGAFVRVAFPGGAC